VKKEKEKRREKEESLEINENNLLEGVLICDVKNQ